MKVNGIWQINSEHGFPVMLNTCKANQVQQCSSIELTILIGIDREAVQKALVPLTKKTMTLGLTIKSTWMKYMIAGKDRSRPICVSAKVVDLKLVKNLLNILHTL